MSTKIYVPPFPTSTVEGGGLLVHVTNSVMRMFLGSLKILKPGEFRQVDTLREADVVLQSSGNELDIISAHPDKFFIIVLLSFPEGSGETGGKIPEDVKNLGEKENVFLMDPPSLIPPKVPQSQWGFTELMRKLDKWYAREGAPKRVDVIVEPADMQACKQTYDILVISHKRAVHPMVEVLLKGHRVTIVETLKEAAQVTGSRKMDAILTDVYLPVDEIFALNVIQGGPPQIAPYGLAVVLYFANRNIPVGVMTDSDPQNDWVAAMFQRLPKQMKINETEVIFRSDLGGMRWDILLKDLMETA